jgi:uncharacterized membrane protein YebE (DUF533 family)
MNKLIFSLALVAAIATASHAQANKRQAVQKARIVEGVQSGDLTRREAAKLAAEQANIKATKQAAKADGVVTPVEKAVIAQKQNRADRHIRKEKNDRQRR